jgi:predicted enzyme related to lactoylglutathione lyase
MSKNPVVHFEMPYQDAARVAAFYEEAFGWNMANLGDQMQQYITAETAETGENRMVKTPGTINGGFYPIASAPDNKEPSVVISVDDLEQAMKDVTAAGGTLLREPTEIPTIGRWVTFKDTEGNRVSMLQPNPRS